MNYINTFTKGFTERIQELRLQRKYNVAYYEHGVIDLIECQKRNMDLSNRLDYFLHIAKFLTEDFLQNKKA